MQKTRTVEGIGMMEGLQGGFGGKDFLRELVHRTVQQVLEAEMTRLSGCRGRRSATGSGWAAATGTSPGR